MVAARAKVSRVAVSRAFNPHTSLKPEKRELIL
jgi:DNA-binding LacI/PurR family transcriptional regulator